MSISRRPFIRARYSNLLTTKDEAMKIVIREIVEGAQKDEELGREITLVNALAQASGAPIEEVEKALKEDTLPLANTELVEVGGGGTITQTRPAKDGKSNVSKEKLKEIAETIRVNGPLIIKASKKDPFSPALSDAATLILHELAHWLQRHYGDNKDKEAGYEFEKKYFGSVQERRTELPK
jgi:hypothetical protein